MGEGGFDEGGKPAGVVGGAGHRVVTKTHLRRA
jgi:hypothetical protein